MGVYDATNVHGDHGASYYAPGGGYPPPVSVYMLPFANQSIAQTEPPGCYVSTGSGASLVTKNPDCDHSQFSDSHISWVSDPGTDTYPACGTTYNFATLSPIPFNAWQGMETCYTTSPNYPAGAPGAGLSLPISGCSNSSYVNPCSFGWAWQFTHTWNLGNNLVFNIQFQISQVSQDGNFMFFGSDTNCQNGSTTGLAPVLYPGTGSYYQDWMITPNPTGMTSLCGAPWQSSTAYTAGQLIDPIETASVGGGVDDVFQALTSGTTGPPSTLNVGQPKCGTVSCFGNTNPPTVTPIAITAITESSTTATVTTASAMTLNVGVRMQISGMTPTSYNGIWTVASVNPTLNQFTLSGLPSGIGPGTVFGLATAQGDTVCDNTSGSGDVINPTLPYSSSCPTGVVWQDLGPQTDRGDLYAVDIGLI
jgi:hypothetical protein